MKTTTFTFLGVSILFTITLATQAAPIVFEGRIVPPEGGSLDHYTVCLEHNEGQRRTPPSDFRIEQAPAANGTFRIEAPPHGDEYWLFVQDQHGRALIGYPHLRTSQDFGTIELRDDGELMGMLYTPDNEPAEKITVLLERRLEARCRHYVPAGKVHTDSQGSFAFAALHPGDYRIRIESDMFTHPADQITVTEDIHYLELQLETAASIRGRVTLPDGTPAEGINVSVHGRRTPATTDEQGFYHISGLGPDTYQLLVISEQMAPKGLSAPSVTLEHEDVTAPDLVVWPLGTLRVTVTPPTPEHTLPENLAIALESQGERFRQTPFEAPLQDGIAIFEGLPPGDFLFLLRDESLGDTQNEITITSEEITELSIDLPEVSVLRGRVVDDEGEPLEDAFAMFYQTPSPQRMFGRDATHSRPVSRHARTDAEGRFRLRGLPAGTGSLNIQMDDRVSHSESITLPLDSDEELVYTLGKGISLRMRILDDTGNPIPDVTISLSPEQAQKQAHHYARSPRAESDAKGLIHLQAIEPGRYQIYVDAPYHYGAVDPVEITNETDHLDDLILHRGQEIIGSVTDADGSPIVGARVSAHTASTSFDHRNYVTRNTETDAYGIFRIGGLPDDTFNITIRDSQYFEELSSLSDVPAGADDVMVILAPQHTIPLQVQTPEGDPIPDATVTVNPADHPFMMHGRGQPENRTNTRGETTVTVRGGNRYTLNVRLRPWVDASRTIDLSEGRDAPEALKVVMQRGITAGGIVMDPAGKPLPAVYVKAADHDPVQTDTQGAFEISGVGPGVLHLHVYNDMETKQPIASQRIFIEDITTDTTEIRISVPLPGSIRGTLRNNEGEPKPGKMVMLNHVSDGYAGHIPPNQTTTDSEGAFAFEDIMPGNYMIMAMQTDAYGGMVTGTMPTMRMVELQAGQERVADLPETILRGETVSGRITREDKPLAAVRIMFIPLDENGKVNMATSMALMGREPTITDADGRYTATNLQPGDYLAIVAKDDSAHPFASPNSQHTVPASIEEGQSELDIHIGGITLRGKVVGENGTPTAGAEVIVSPTFLDIMTQGMLSKTVETDADGFFEIEDLSAGPLRITIMDETNREAITTTMEIETDTYLEQAIQLAAGIRIEGNVRREPEGAIGHTFIMAFAEDGNPLGAANVDSDGHFEIANILPPGRYYVACLHQELIAPGKFVDENSEDPLAFVLKPGGDVTVSLSGPPDQIKGRNLQISDADGNEIQRMHTSFDLGYMSSMTKSLSLLPTDEKGQTTVHGLPAGTYTIRIIDSDAYGTVTVAPFAQTTLELEL